MKRAALASLAALVVGLPCGFIWIAINFLDFTADGLVAGVVVYGIIGFALGTFSEDYWYITILVIWIPVALVVPAFDRETFDKALFVLGSTAGPSLVSAYAGNLTNR